MLWRFLCNFIDLLEILLQVRHHFNFHRCVLLEFFSQLNGHVVHGACCCKDLVPCCNHMLVGLAINSSIFINATMPLPFLLWQKLLPYTEPNSLWSGLYLVTACRSLISWPPIQVVFHFNLCARSQMLVLSSH